MSENYSEIIDVTRRIGMAFDVDTRPSETDVGGMLDNATAIINAEGRVTDNMTDGSGRLKEIEITLVMKMINNYLYFINPTKYALLDIELTEEQKRIIHKEQLKFYGESFEIGT